ncbi:MAG TPA: aldo/keto reductase [Gemmatimonadaceae bacterium]|nr:aldo/keto reductase [Gemmatimonadaceae bacterium]
MGTWAIGGETGLMSWGPQDDKDSLDTLRHAVELGMNWIDTAPAYGLGHAEELIGGFLSELPEGERPYIFTKCGIVWDERNPAAGSRRILTPESIRRECDASLRRLGVERIDLYQFHWPDEIGTPVEDSWGEMSRLVDEGKVRWAGVSNFDVALLERCERIRHVDSLQPPFSLIRRDVAASEIPWCMEHGTGVICYSPLQSGLLTDTFSAERVANLPKTDWRRSSRYFQSPNLEKNLALRDALRPIAARHDATVAAVAIAWVLAWPGVTAAIAGARRPDQIDGWISAAKLRLTSEDLEEIATAIERTGAGSGPARPASERVGSRS